MTDTTPERLAVFGHPIGHSRSPALHSAAYAALGLPWSYEALDVTGETLPAELDRGWRGVSLTMPLKRDVVPLLNTVDPLVRLTGAANTVLIDGGRRFGYNTDVGGIVDTLRRHGITRIRHAVLLGGGATAASALAAVAEVGAREATVVVRDPRRASDLRRLGAALDVKLTVSALETTTLVPGADIVISTIPGDATDGVDYQAALATECPLLDVVYDPWPTRLAARWHADGGQVISGLHMLLHQAVRQVRIFVLQDADLPLPHEDRVLTAMRHSVGMTDEPAEQHLGDEPVE